MIKRSRKSTSFEASKAPHEPIPWRQLVGYDEAKSRFKTLIHGGRLPPAILIEGREGCAKRVFVAYLCALVWCDTKDACGSCSDCRAIQAFYHEEVYWLESNDGKNYKVEDIEGLQEHLEIKSGSRGNGCGKRIITIIDCDLLNRQGANRLLKTLEEPPDDSLIIMTTSHPGQLLPTMMSRLFRYKIKPPSFEEGVSWLSEEVGSEFSEKRVAMVLRASGLSLGRAKSRLEFGEDSEDEYQSLVDALFAQHPAESIKLIEEHVKQKKVPANELAKRIEVILNQYYRVSLGLPRDMEGFQIASDIPAPSLRQLRHWRKFLIEVKAMTIGGKIALNGQLIAESWAMAGSR